MTRRFAFPVERYWSSQRGLATLLLSLSLLIFLVLPLETSGLIGPRWMVGVDVWMAAVILAGA